MEPLYTIRAWAHSTEDNIIQCIEEVFLRKGYKTKNFHAKDRIHEFGIDLECRKESEKFVFAVKKKPKKQDVKQLQTFARSSKDKGGIYVYVESPTRPFEQCEKSLDELTFWDASKLHEELVKNESIYYLCLLFSVHPVADALTKVNEVIYEKRKTNYLQRKLTAQELDKLWVAKDNIVKMRSMLLSLYTRWTRKLMTKSSRDPREFQTIIDEIFEELDVIDLLSSEKLVSSFVEIAEKHPDLFGLYWNNVAKRTNWKYFVVAVEKHPEPVSDFIRLRWVIPRLDRSSLSVMRGFYSGVNYILENFHTVANNLEDGIDWVFEDMRP